MSATVAFWFVAWCLLFFLIFGLVHLWRAFRLLRDWLKENAGEVGVVALYAAVNATVLTAVVYSISPH